MVDGHRQALQYDLMTRTRYVLEDLGGALSAAALVAFVRYLPPDSALVMECEPDSAWSTGRYVAQLLALLADEVAVSNYMYATAHAKGGHRAERPRPIPRPGVSESDRERRVGRGAIPISEFDRWYGGDR